jgi:hypothetical protein
VAEYHNEAEEEGLEEIACTQEPVPACLTSGSSPVHQLRAGNPERSAQKAVNVLEEQVQIVGTILVLLAALQIQVADPEPRTLGIAFAEAESPIRWAGFAAKAAQGVRSSEDVRSGQMATQTQIAVPE